MKGIGADVDGVFWFGVGEIWSCVQSVVSVFKAQSEERVTK